MSITQYIFVNFTSAQTLEEKVNEAKATQLFQSFEAEIKSMQSFIDKLDVDESLDPLIKNKIDGIGGGGGKIIKTKNSIANSLLKDLQEDIFGKNKIIFTESEAIRLRQTIHRRIARLLSAMDALENIQVKGDVLPTMSEAQSSFFQK